MNYNKERYEFIEKMFDSIAQIPIEAIIGRYLNLVQRGRHFMGLCPFHKDTKLGSFIVTPDKGLWKCFTCGDDYAGNGIKFVSLYKNISYLEAAFDIALEHGVISRDEYETFSKKKYDASYISTLERRYSDKKQDAPQPKKASAVVINNVYQVIKNNCSLSEEHRKALKETRGLSDERIDKDYFTCPTNWRQKDNIISEIKKQYPEYTNDVLQTVPGFFYSKKDKKITFSGYKGLCILIRDANDKIQAVQIRRDTIKEGDSRYVWLSSTFAFYKPEEYEGGCGCGSPKDVLWGDKNKNCVCITEGRFKSEILSQNGNTSISIQGVSSWNGIDIAIADIMKTQSLKNVFVFLDADIFAKHALFVQSAKMCNYIHEKFPSLGIKYAFWNKNVGKGIDDFILAGGTVRTYVPYEKATKECESIFEAQLKRYGITRLQDLDNNQISSFETELQNACEKNFVK